MVLEQEYLEQIAEQIFPIHGRSEKQYKLFLQRFLPNNYEYRNTEIARSLSQMNTEEDYETGLQQNIKEVIIKFYSVFSVELEASEITTEHIGIGLEKTGKKGRKTSKEKKDWQKIYDWLWGEPYSIWLQNYIWEVWKKTAQTARNWLQFSPLSSEYASKGLKIPSPISPENIPAQTPLNLKLQIDHLEGYLILLNRGTPQNGAITQCLITPSQAFAPNYQLKDTNLFIPQKDAMCKDLQFEVEGTEEFIGIVIDHPLNLSWLNPNPKDPAFKWEGKHLYELWEHLKRQKDKYQIFYYQAEVRSVLNN